MARGVESRHEGGPRGSAIGGRRISIGEGHPLFRKAVDVGGTVVIRSLAGKIGVAQVIGVEEDDVGLCLLSGNSRHGEDQKGGKEGGQGEMWHGNGVGF